MLKEYFKGTYRNIYVYIVIEIQNSMQGRCEAERNEKRTIQKSENDQIMQIVHYFYFFFLINIQSQKRKTFQTFLAQPGVLVFRKKEELVRRKGSSLRMISRQTRMAASAPMLSFSVWPSWMSSQFSPQKPSGQSHR